MARRDPHSYTDDGQVETESFDLVAKLDFAGKVLRGEVTLTFRTPGGGTLDLDTRDLEIEAVRDDAERVLPFTLHPAEPILGARLAIELPEGTGAIRIRYRTSPDASALQWLAPAQTAGGQHPFLFSQCQAIHARSVIPLQDSPRLRVRYTVELTVPKTLRAVVAAAHRGRTEDGELATERYEMPQPIPPYLFAFAVGDLASHDLSPRSRVWAEPSVLQKAAHEFAGVEAMIEAAEQLFGPYDWERFDILTMPPSFPYGGMENPRLTFLTPTLLAGDRSLVGVVAHELAHSWTGNLVTNANAEHFWLNEGFTVFAERRILEAIDGSDVAALDAALGRKELDHAVERFKEQPGLTRLRTHLTGIDPDDAFSQVPYEKGYFFLCALEQATGRDAFEAWLKSYIAAFRFGAITTDDFIVHFEHALPGVLAKVDGERWINGEGVPEDAPRPRSDRLAAIEAIGIELPEPKVASRWTPVEWQLHLEAGNRSAETCRVLDAAHGLTASTNYEVLVSWLTLALRCRVLEVLPRVEQVLAEVGRMKYLRPLYSALREVDAARAATVFAANRAGYHPIARQMVEGLLT
ncbi:MAG: M1 family metallopeptidase [Nannocystis sp.]|nr:M1 family metallopeptidase [Nannocystis sp.]MBA3550105.1 M1 family metallopeptidase [Nannocystis sp.]